MKNSQNDYEKEKDTSALGFCPECKQPFEYLNIGSDQMAYCHQCQTKYKAGVNMFSTWLDEQEAKWRRNQKRLANYRTVKPLAEAPDEANAETDYKNLLEYAHPTVSAEEAIDFCLQQFLNDKSIALGDELAKNLNFQEVLGALLLAQDRLEAYRADWERLNEEYEL
jgi:hypothetical protein